MDEKFKIDKPHVEPMSDRQFERWIVYQERKDNVRNGLIGLLGFVAIIAATVVILVWSPWN